MPTPIDSLLFRVFDAEVERKAKAMEDLGFPSLASAYRSSLVRSATLEKVRGTQAFKDAEEAYIKGEIEQNVLSQLLGIVKTVLPLVLAAI